MTTSSKPRGVPRDKLSRLRFMRNKIIGYTILVILYTASLFVWSDRGAWFPSIGAIVAVVAAMSAGNIRLPGITVVFFVITFLIPVTMLYLMGLHAQMDAPLRQLFQSLDWLRVVLPWMLAVVTYYFFNWVKVRLAKKRTV